MMDENEQQHLGIELGPNRVLWEITDTGRNLISRKTWPGEETPIIYYHFLFTQDDEARMRNGSIQLMPKNLLYIGERQRASALKFGLRSYP